MVDGNFREHTALRCAVLGVIALVCGNEPGNQVRIRHGRNVPLVTAITAGAGFEDREHLFFAAGVRLPLQRSTHCRQIEGTIAQHKVVGIRLAVNRNGGDDRIGILRRVQMPDNAVGVAHIVVQRIPALAALQHDPHIPAAAVVFQSPALVGVVGPREQVDRLTIFDGAVLMVAQDVHILPGLHVLQFIVVVEFVSHLSFLLYIF